MRLPVPSASRRLRPTSARLATLALLLGLTACESAPTSVAVATPRVRPRAVSTARARADASSGYVIGADGVRLYYEVRGHGPDTVVVLHGGAGLTMSYLIDDLAPLEPSRTLIYYDQRGSGGSDLVDASRLTADRMVADLEALRQHFGLTQMTLLGSSWGGALAALYATTHPDRVARLVLLGPGPSSSSLGGPEIQALIARFSPAELGELIALNQQFATAPDDQTAALCEQTYAFLFARYQLDAASLGAMRGRWCSGSPAAMRYGAFVTQDAVGASLGTVFDIAGALTAALGGRQVPTLIVEGAASPFVQSARAYAAAIPGAQLVVLANAGHFAWLEEPHTFFHVVSQFLERTKHLAK